MGGKGAAYSTVITMRHRRTFHRTERLASPAERQPAAARHRVHHYTVMPGTSLPGSPPSNVHRRRTTRIQADNCHHRNIPDIAYMIPFLMSRRFPNRPKKYRSWRAALDGPHPAHRQTPRPGRPSSKENPPPIQGYTPAPRSVRPMDVPDRLASQGHRKYPRKTLSRPDNPCHGDETYEPDIKRLASRLSGARFYGRPLPYGVRRGYLYRPT
jgi:hypothetical protein